jgi:hypothetical protein
MRDFLKHCWQHLREWSGDDAYERYLLAHRDHQHRLLTRREFYRDYLDRRGKRPRCC